MVLKQNLFILGSEGVIGSKITPYFENEYNIFKYDYSLGHDFTDVQIVEKIFKENPCYGLINLYALNEHVGISKQAQSYEDFDIEEMKKILSVNVVSLFNVCRTFCKYNLSGSVINFSSIYGLRPPDNNLYKGRDMKSISYSVSKSSVIPLTQYFAKNIPNGDYRFNVIAPGGVFNDQNKDFVEKYSSKVPLKRMCYPIDLIEPIRFLLSKGSSYVNGIVLPVDGGFSIWKKIFYS